MFESELRYFVEHQDELVAKYRGSVLVIEGDELLGVYPDPLRAYVETTKQFSPGTFMLQPCQPGPDAYTVTISSVELFEAPR